VQKGTLILHFTEVWGGIRVTRLVVSPTKIHERRPGIRKILHRYCFGLLATELISFDQNHNLFCLATPIRDFDILDFFELVLSHHHFFFFERASSPCLEEGKDLSGISSR